MGQPRLYQCSECAYTSAKSFNLLRHQQKKHPTSLPVVCKWCNARLASTSMLSRHLRMSHYHTCECGQRFKTAEDLKAHQITHEGGADVIAIAAAAAATSAATAASKPTTVSALSAAKKKQRRSNSSMIAGQRARTTSMSSVSSAASLVAADLEYPCSGPSSPSLSDDLTDSELTLTGGAGHGSVDTVVPQLTMEDLSEPVIAFTLDELAFDQSPPVTFSFSNSNTGAFSFSAPSACSSSDFSSFSSAAFFAPPPLFPPAHQPVSSSCSPLDYLDSTFSSGSSSGSSGSGSEAYSSAFLSAVLKDGLGNVPDLVSMLPFMS